MLIVRSASVLVLPTIFKYDDNYEHYNYINNLNLVWKECYRTLHNGCRLCVNIDYLGWVGNKAFGIPIKPVTAKANFGNYAPTERMKANFDDFTKKFGGQVFVFKMAGDVVLLHFCTSTKSSVCAYPSSFRQLDTTLHTVRCTSR